MNNRDVNGSGEKHLPPPIPNRQNVPKHPPVPDLLLRTKEKRPHTPVLPFPFNKILVRTLNLNREHTPLHVPDVDWKRETGMWHVQRPFLPCQIGMLHVQRLFEKMQNGTWHVQRLFEKMQNGTWHVQRLVRKMQNIILHVFTPNRTMLN
jgi:hypothetical protein